jgi:AcrR family transcriptional regulator
MDIVEEQIKCRRSGRTKIKQTPVFYGGGRDGIGRGGVTDVKETVELSKQQQKSKETRERIFRAAKQILKKKGYDELSIKNICEEAGVSNGSFYYHFKTKDDLLSYYIEEQPSINPALLELPRNADEAKIAIVRVYLNYVAYCRELGVEFMSGYYNPKNQALNAAIRTERPYPIVTVQAYVEKAALAGIIRLGVEIEAFTTDIRMIVIGNVFEWCLRNGETDFEGNMRRSLGKYLDSTIF